MDQETSKIIQDQLAILPEDVKQAIFSVDYKKQLQEIVKRNGLLINQAGALELETTLTLIGLELQEDYIENIARELELPREKAVIVAHDVDELIFKNVRNYLKKISDDVTAADVLLASQGGAELNKDGLVYGIENPKEIKSQEESVSISSLKSNSLNPEYPVEKVTNGIEVRRELSLEIPPEAKLPIKSFVSSQEEKNKEPFHQNISPVQNIVEEKLTNNISIPKEKIVVEETSKLPTKEHDPYREPII